METKISHHGAIEFQNGEYVRVAGTDNWEVQPIEGFDPPVRLPVGMIEITFKEPIKEPYTVMLSAHRTEQSPLTTANYGEVTENGFVVHMWETIADRTLQNSNFSFMVLRT